MAKLKGVKPTNPSSIASKIANSKFSGTLGGALVVGGLGLSAIVFNKVINRTLGKEAGPFDPESAILKPFTIQGYGRGLNQQWTSNPNDNATVMTSMLNMRRYRNIK